MRKQIHTLTEGKVTRLFNPDGISTFFWQYFAKVFHANSIRTVDSHEDFNSVEVSFEVDINTDDFPSGSVVDKVNKKVETYFDPLNNGYNSYSVGKFKVKKGNTDGTMVLCITIDGKKEKGFDAKEVPEKQDRKKQDDFEDRTSGKW